MKLAKLVSSLSNYEPHGSLEIAISGIADDSRKVAPGNLFVAIQGLTVDSHNNIPQAIKNGAAAVLGERKAQDLELGSVPYIRVKDSRSTLGILASTWYGNPSHKLKVIGVTGTEGKTTTCSLIYHILKTAGKRVGLISTINAKIADELIDTGLHVTNPEALPLQELLAKMIENNCEYAVVETTSIGLHQGRVAGVEYTVGTLTNFAQDHLDYHRTMEAYREAKAILFKRVDSAVLNKDDESFEYYQNQLSKETKLISYGLHKNADIKGENLEFSAQGTKFSIYSQGQSTQIESRLLGEYNVSNMLAASASCFVLGLDWSQIKPGLETFVTPEGRLERIDEGQNFGVLVDFAHSPNALEKVLRVLRQLALADKRLIAVYGSAGERDATKRPAMGKSARHANITIFTADDPRREEVVDIIAQMEEGARKVGVMHVGRQDLLLHPDKSVYVIEPNRTNAISLALENAREGDTVAILGKGHEKSLAVKGDEVPWSDQEVIRKILRRLVAN